MKLSDVKFLKMSRKDYGEYVICGKDVGNYPEWRKWMQKDCGVIRDGLDKVCLVSGDNRKRFKKHFGKCAFTYNNGPGHFFHCWLVDLGTAQVIVLTASEHGTCYEVVTRRAGQSVQADIPRVLEFIDMVAELPKEEK